MLAAVKNLPSNGSYGRNLDGSHLHHAFFFHLLSFFAIGPSQTFCQIAATRRAVPESPQGFLTEQASETRGGLL